MIKYGKAAFTAICITCAAIAQAASFDCAKAGNTTERLICSDTGLSAMDDQLAVAYRLAVVANPEIKSAQIDWIKKTRACGADQNSALQCLKREYSERIQTLSLQAKVMSVPAEAVRAPALPVTPSAGFSSSSVLATAPALSESAEKPKSRLIDQTGRLTESDVLEIRRQFARLDQLDRTALLALISDPNEHDVAAYAERLRSEGRNDVAIVLNMSTGKSVFAFSEEASKASDAQGLASRATKGITEGILSERLIVGLAMAVGGLDVFFRQIQINGVKQAEDEAYARRAQEIADQSAALKTAAVEPTAAIVNTEPVSSSTSVVRDEPSKMLPVLESIAKFFVAVFVILAILSVPVALILRFSRGTIIFENLTDATFTLAFPLFGLAVSASVASIFPYEQKDAVGIAIYAGFLLVHLIWMKKVAKRSNMSGTHTWIVAFARTLISIIPILYLCSGKQPIAAKKSYESDVQYLSRYRSETEKNVHRERNKTVLGVLLVGITTAAIDKFSFEKLSTYFGRNTAFIADEKSRRIDAHAI